MPSDDTTNLGATLSAVPAGRWALAVSGGADSVALLMLAVNARPVSAWHVIHLDHETRGGASAEDARFVQILCDHLGVELTIRRISELNLKDPPANRSARFRTARLHLFRTVVHDRQLAGVLQAHHAGDQAETVLLRLLRGGRATGIRPRSVVNGLTILRPLLGATTVQLRDFLRQIGQPWREDESNRSPAYARNRARIWLADKPEFTSGLIRLGEAGSAVTGWVATASPLLGETFETKKLAELPGILAVESSKRWLLARGASEVDGSSCRRLIAMATDLATPASAHFPGNLRVRRRSGRIFAEKQGENRCIVDK
jgi:tRNA(Ile)-lysidine synthetase-like protein